ncbi:RNA polymerase sigma factor [Colwellia sp. MB02u-14]|uniref:RNA polymerase sigma factor n=1 Tax=Colwellia sp. MB02u-14 TaxID=2759815 RepID=UPI0015F55D6D|nr:sigma-70 family RNA polymerase sigma factor [Colwellia sp. MB02u-14]MBA6301992.1 sigma-70 family RNA polymerase sigma factor [Colwellia sp. MB02u-14]
MLKINVLSGMLAGENEAFEKCYRLFSPALYGFIIRICRDESTANDLLQDTFVDAFNSIGSFDKNRCFASWIKRIGFNNTLNNIKKVKRQQEVFSQLTYLFTDGSYVNNEAENQNLLDNLLAQITETERMVLWLSVVEQYKHDEIGRIFNKTASFSKSTLSRTLKKLKIKSEAKKYAG